MKSKLTAPKNSDPAIQKSFNRIFDELNLIKNSMKSASVADTESLGSGDKGDMRVSQNSDESVSLEVRVKDGWYGSQLFETNPGITSITDSTTGTSSDTINDTTSSVKDDLASLAGKINEIITIIMGLFSAVIDRSPIDRFGGNAAAQSLLQQTQVATTRADQLWDPNSIRNQLQQQQLMQNMHDLQAGQSLQASRLAAKTGGAGLATAAALNTGVG